MWWDRHPACRARDKSCFVVAEASCLSRNREELFSGGRGILPVAQPRRVVFWWQRHPACRIGQGWGK
ncbi:hypothetical protein [Microseira wollei]|uniref:hypothetical protein n=1 Tax=Microseira wollei TaxID=467598 RepID=UPI001CFCBD94|nr:hypothetical protein [Microseira wollei]